VPFVKIQESVVIANQDFIWARTNNALRVLRIARIALMVSIALNAKLDFILMRKRNVVLVRKVVRMDVSMRTLVLQLMWLILLLVQRELKYRFFIDLIDIHQECLF